MYKINFMQLQPTKKNAFSTVVELEDNSFEKVDFRNLTGNLLCKFVTDEGGEGGSTGGSTGGTNGVGNSYGGTNGIGNSYGGTNGIGNPNGGRMESIASLLLSTQQSIPSPNASFNELLSSRNTLLNSSK